MNLEELYNRITNPLDIPTVERLIEIFGTNLSFYNGLSKGNGLSNKERVLQKDYDRVRNELLLIKSFQILLLKMLRWKIYMININGIL